MPGRDGTGPMGRGAITGKGLGICAMGNAVKYGAGLGLGLGLGLGCRRGFGRYRSRSDRIKNTKRIADGAKEAA